VCVTAETLTIFTSFHPSSMTLSIPPVRRHSHDLAIGFDTLPPHPFLFGLRRLHRRPRFARLLGHQPLPVFGCQPVHTALGHRYPRQRCEARSGTSMRRYLHAKPQRRFNCLRTPRMFGQLQPAVEGEKRPL
jgi:hypothetical protein